MLTHDQARHLATLYGTAIRARALDIVAIANSELCSYINQTPKAARNGIIWDLLTYANPVSEAMENNSDETLHS